MERLLTRQEWNRLVALKPFVHYTQEEVAFFLRIGAEFVDPNISQKCHTCPGSNVNVKQVVYSWFNEQKNLIDDQLKKLEAESNATEYIQKNPIPFKPTAYPDSFKDEVGTLIDDINKLKLDALKDETDEVE